MLGIVNVLFPGMVEGGGRGHSLCVHKFSLFPRLYIYMHFFADHLFDIQLKFVSSHACMILVAYQ